jgi:hypothetical protein
MEGPRGRCRHQETSDHGESSDAAVFDRVRSSVDLSDIRTTENPHSLALVQVDYPGDEEEYRKRNGSALVGCIDPEAPLG